MKRLNQSGSHVIAIALLVAVLGIAGFAGYRVMSANKQKTPTTTASTTTTMPASDTIKNTADLTQAANTLDSSSSQVSSNLDDSALNNDLNDML